MNLIEQQIEAQKAWQEAKKKSGEDQGEQFEPATQQSRKAGITGAVRSKYESIGGLDDGGHQSAWGSYWHKHFGWGYKCCYGFEKFSLASN
jgi:hypothetical protein